MPFSSHKYSRAVVQLLNNRKIALQNFPHSFKGRHKHNKTQPTDANASTHTIVKRIHTAERRPKEVAPQVFHQRERQLQLRLGHHEPYKLQTDRQSLPVRQTRPQQVKREGVPPPGTPAPANAAVAADTTTETVSEVGGYAGLSRRRLCLPSIPQKFLLREIYRSGAERGYQCYAVMFGISTRNLDIFVSV